MDFFSVIQTLHSDDSKSINNLLLTSIHISQLTNHPDEIYSTGFQFSYGLSDASIILLFDIKNDTLIHQCLRSTQLIPRFLGLKMFLNHENDSFYYSPFNKTNVEQQYKVEFFGSYSLEYKFFDNPLSLLYTSVVSSENISSLEDYDMFKVKSRIKDKHEEKFAKKFSFYLDIGPTVVYHDFRFAKYHNHQVVFSKDPMESFFKYCRVKRKTSSISIHGQANEYLEMLDKEHSDWSAGQ